MSKDEIIAELNIVGVKPNGDKIDITVKIGKPYPVAIDDWACPVALPQLYNRLPDMHGVDSFQALCLASNLAITLLRSFKEKGGKLIYEDGIEFPLEAYLPVKNENSQQ